MTGRNHTTVDSRSGWSRRGVLSAAAVAGAGALSSGLTSCSGGSGDSDHTLKKKIDHPSDNLKKKGMPIVKDPISVEFMTKKPYLTAKDYNKVANWEKYQKMTNIKVKWGLVPSDDVSEKRNLALSSGDHPEVFNATEISVRDVGKYGHQGVFIKTNDLIDKYLPNLKKLMQDNAYIRRGMKFPDGNIYGLPYIADPDFTSYRIQYIPWVRRDWLDKFDMDIPTTTEEYHKYLKTVKSKEPNGRGKTIPYGSSHKADELFAALLGSFGISNRGRYAGNVDADPKDKKKARFYPITDEYKALMEYLHTLYSEGLIAKDIFSMDSSKAFDAVNKGVYGSTVEIAPYDLRGGEAKNFVVMPALKGPEGHHAYNNVTPALKSIGNFVITDKCKHPVEIARWADYFYSDEGAKLFFMGVQGKSYKETDDGVEYIDEIKHPKKGISADRARRPYVTYQGGGYGANIVKEKYFKGAESTEEQIKGVKQIEPDTDLEEILPHFTFTEDEFQKLESMADDIEKYVSESRDKFITGELKLSKWDKYVDKIKKMDLDGYMEIQQAAYDRLREGS